MICKLNSTINRPVQLSDGAFQEALKKYPALVVDMWAEWCYPCRMVAPIVEELASEYKDRVVFGKLNVDENPRTAETYEVMAIPTLLMFRGGKLVDRVVGALPKASLKARIDHVLSQT